MAHFTAADDLLHELSDPVTGRESLFFVMPIPDEGMLAMAYMWVDAHNGKWGRIIGVTDRLGGQPSYNSVVADLELEGANLDDCRCGGLTLRLPEPLRTAELQFDDGTVSLDVRMTGLHTPFSWQQGLGGCPSWAADDRFEQSVRAEGTVTLRGRTVPLPGYAHRDHSWGTRDWRPLQHWKWMNGGSRDGELSWHAWISHALGDTQVNGYVNRAGKVSPIIGLDAHSELDDEFMHTRTTARLRTLDGRELSWESEASAGMPIPARHMQMQEVAGTATAEGRSCVTHIEHGWPAAYVADYAQPAPAAAAS